MNSSRPSDQTIDYYDRHAQAYADATLNVCMEALYHPFLELLPEGAHILDVGCGSGRDSREFKRRGYRITAIDASAKMAEMAMEIIGQAVEVVRFEELTSEDAFDGIWACASLLHIPAEAINDVLDRLTRAVRRGGVIYASFKFGAGQEIRENRLFSHHTEQSLRELIARHPRLEVARIWRTQNVMPGRNEQEWLNVLMRKVAKGVASLLQLPGEGVLSTLLDF